MSEAITERYRPKHIADIVGQSAATTLLSRFIAAPYSCAFLLSGGSGIGKSSAAMALATDLGCDMRPNCYGLGGFFQISAGDQKVDQVKDQARLLRNLPFYGSGWRCLVCNETDQSSPQAQVAWLDILENLPQKCCVVFTTNILNDLAPRFQDRCTVIPFVSGTGVEYTRAANELIARIWTAERPGESIPTIGDLDAIPSGSAISYRRVVQACARRLLDPSPFVPASIEVPASIFSASPPVKPKTAAPFKRPAGVKAYKDMTWTERREYERKQFIASQQEHFDNQAISA
jgi:hypothetical protein